MIEFRTNTDLKITRKVPCTRSVTERMADDMRELAFAGYNVSVETLAVRGYPADVVRRFGTKATEVARRQSTRQIAEA
jgi:hypothetical protein